MARASGAEDWIILERLQQAAVELRPVRVVFVEVKVAQPVVACEGRFFDGDSGLDLRQMGCPGLLGPEFSFSALISFEGGESCWRTRIFDICSGPDRDSIFVEVLPGTRCEEDPECLLGDLVFGVTPHDGEPYLLEVPGCWSASAEPLAYLFTVSATGMMRVYVDGELVAEAQGVAVPAMERGEWHVGGEPDACFVGGITQVKVWNHCVDPSTTETLFVAETERALAQFAQWYAEDHLHARSSRLRHTPGSAPPSIGRRLPHPKVPTKRLRRVCATCASLE